MKHLLFLFSLFFTFIFSCSESPTNDIKDTEEIDEPKAIVPGYKILKKESTFFIFSQGTSIPYSKIEKFTEVYTYEYNLDNTIKDYLMVRTIEEYDYDRKNDYNASDLNWTSLDTDLFTFNYKDDKIDYIIHKHTQVNGKSRYNARIDFEYNEEDYLSRYNQYETSPFFGRFQTDYHLEWSKDMITFIPSENIYWPRKNIILDKYGNFKRREGSSTKYDNKNNPNDLVYPKHLLGYMEYGSGNVIILENYGETLTGDEECNCEYIYNDFDFPIKYIKHFNDGRPDLEITYTYSSE